jgi:DNA helicase-2/ATP-dependent DNA helicase PcrA
VHKNVAIIGKKANFRSVPVIVNSLNQIRPELPQEVSDPQAQGVVSIVHTNEWEGTRLSGGHWGGDLPPEIAHDYLENLRAKLINEGWDFSPDKTKILMLTNRFC